MIEPKLTLFQMQMKSPLADATKLAQARFGKAPEVLDPINMVATLGKFILAMLYAVMLFITEIHKPVVGPESIGIDNGVEVDLLLYNRQQNVTRTILYYLRKHLATSLYQPENDVLSASPASSNPTHSSRAKVTFIDFYFASIKRTLRLRKLGDSLTNLSKNIINCHSRNAGKSSNFCRFEIKREELHDLAELSICNS